MTHASTKDTQTLTGKSGSVSNSFLLGPGVHNVLFMPSNSLFPQSCGSSVIAKFRLELKKVGKITRPFRYDLNQIPYGYTVEVTKRFKGLDLIHRGPEELWTEVWNIVQEAVIKTIPKKKKCKKAKWLSEEVLQIAEKRRDTKGKGEKEIYTHLHAEF